MTDVIAPTKTVTFTVKSMPKRDAQRKTIERLMSMQPEVRKSLRKLAVRRRLHDNKPGIRAGVMWVDRAKATRPARVEKGAEFTLRLTPQIIPDVKSVEQYLEAK